MRTETLALTMFSMSLPMYIAETIVDADRNEFTTTNYDDDEG